MKRMMRRMVIELRRAVERMKDRRARAELREHEEREYAAMKRVSVTVWRDELWLTVDGLPVICKADMTESMVDAVSKAQDNVACYLEDVRTKNDV